MEALAPNGNGAPAIEGLKCILHAPTHMSAWSHVHGSWHMFLNWADAAYKCLAWHFQVHRCPMLMSRRWLALTSFNNAHHHQHCAHHSSLQAMPTASKSTCNANMEDDLLAHLGAGQRPAPQELAHQQTRTLQWVRLLGGSPTQIGQLSTPAVPAANMHTTNVNTTLACKHMHNASVNATQGNQLCCNTHTNAVDHHDLQALSQHSATETCQCFVLMHVTKQVCGNACQWFGKVVANCNES
jgi:hypothetical protein